MPDRRYRRRSARVLLIDDADRILLFRGYLVRDDPSRWAWFTPGGGVDKGETLPVAASRELREETGLSVPPDALGPVVAWTSGYADLGFAAGVFRDDFFLYRTSGWDVDTSGFQSIERSMIIDHRWWPVSESWPTPPRSCTRCVWSSCWSSCSPAGYPSSRSPCPGTTERQRRRGPLCAGDLCATARAGVPDAAPAHPPAGLCGNVS